MSGRWGLVVPIETDVFSERSGSGEPFGGFPANPFPDNSYTHRIPVDKRTHRIRFEDETEDVVTIVIEPK